MPKISCACHGLLCLPNSESRQKGVSVPLARPCFTMFCFVSRRNAGILHIKRLDHLSLNIEWSEATAHVNRHHHLSLQSEWREAILHTRSLLVQLIDDCIYTEHHCALAVLVIIFLERANALKRHFTLAALNICLLAVTTLSTMDTCSLHLRLPVQKECAEAPRRASRPQHHIHQRESVLSAIVPSHFSSLAPFGERML